MTQREKERSVVKLLKQSGVSKETMLCVMTFLSKVKSKTVFDEMADWLKKNQESFLTKDSGDVESEIAGKVIELYCE